jgi:hypothetical protein
MLLLLLLLFAAVAAVAAAAAILLLALHNQRNGRAIKERDRACAECKPEQSTPIKTEGATQASRAAPPLLVAAVQLLLSSRLTVNNKQLEEELSFSTDESRNSLLGTDGTVPTPVPTAIALLHSPMFDLTL